jgi:hypothetical protein
MWEFPHGSILLHINNEITLPDINKAINRHSEELEELLSGTLKTQVISMYSFSFST